MPRDELVRLVVVEDKLFRNPEQHRKVLAQLLDYAHRLQYSVEIDALIATAPKQTRELLEGDRETLARVLRTGDFLLLVAGDRVQPRLITFMKPLLDRRASLMSRFEMGLLSLALYQHGDQLVLVPNVVGAIARGERDLCFEVVVRTEAGETAPARVALVEPAGAATETAERLRAPTWARDTLLAQTREDLAPDHEKTVRMLERLLDVASVRPFGIRWGAGKKVGTFSVFVRSRHGDLSILGADSNGWVQIHGREIARLLGEETKKREIAALAEALGKPIAIEKAYPYLPTDFDTSDDPRHFAALTTFLRRVADAIEATGDRPAE